MSSEAWMNWDTGDWMVLEGPAKGKVKCLCRCGVKKIVFVSNLKRGLSRSCGHDRRTQRGLSMTPAYSSYTAMLFRCSSVQHKSYKNYGGRGITVCDRWRGPEGFINFVADMGERPENHTLDRIDNDSNYEPSNCRWATVAAQNSNTSRTRRYRAFGELLTVSQFAAKYGFRTTTIFNRLDNMNMSIEEALTKPLDMAQSKRRRKYA